MGAIKFPPNLIIMQSAIVSYIITLVVNIIFDLDGTLADSTKKSIEILNRFLLENKQSPVTINQVRTMGIKRLIKTKVPGKLKVLRLVALGRTRIAPFMANFNLYKSFDEILPILAKNNTLGIITSNSELNARDFLKKHTIENYFKFVYSENSLFGKHKVINKVIKTYSLDKNQTAYIGDETRDIEAARKAGVKSIAVAWGYESGEVLAAAKPDFIVENPKQLLSVLTSL